MKIIILITFLLSGMLGGYAVQQTPIGQEIFESVSLKSETVANEQVVRTSINTIAISNKPTLDQEPVAENGTVTANDSDTVVNDEAVPVQETENVEQVADVVTKDSVAKETVAEESVATETVTKEDVATENVATEIIAKEPVKNEQEFKLENVNGLTLYDGRDEMIEKLGQPDDMQQDEFFAEIDIYYYPSMRVAFYEDTIRYVEYDTDIKELLIDNVKVPATIEAVSKALGTPDYVADDGIVFQRDEALLKLFIDSDTGELEFISYYHLASV